MMSAAFLPAYAIYKAAGRQNFKDIWSALQMQEDHEARLEMIKDLSTCVGKRRAGKDSPSAMEADAVYWLVYHSADVRDWTREQQDAALDKAHAALEKYYPDIVRLPRKHLDKESPLPLWVHPEDRRSDMESYHRALQLLRCCERIEQQGEGTIKERPPAVKWMGHWTDPALFDPQPIGEELIPPWMRKRMNRTDVLKLANKFHETHAPAPVKSACEIVYIVDCNASRFRSANKQWFKECLENLESLTPLPSNLKATSDPRDQSCIEQWRDAIRRELGLAYKWRRDDQGLVLKLTGLRLESGEEQRLWCYDPKSTVYSCTHD
ncbi:hypothetical protein CBER1_11455 [Cercospora berteroae]|uniref:Uncharacterized protein n=1 Tax=Cercospora berteroae TaxID=357750 RepID=A0A2S6C061_9PEZI|nr:hypothetical protein CBER1_11455 [Cercospora berteroae]